MRRASMDLRSEFGLFLTVLLSVLLLALFLSLPEGMGLAAPSTLIVPPIPAELAEQQEDIPYCGTPPEGCNKIQVIVMIDQSGSISVNDPKRLRFSGAENLVKLLAYRYLEAGESQTVTPTIQLSVLHFGSSVLPYNPEWITIAPKSQEDWEAQFKDLKTKISPEGLRRGEATNFIRPFEAARNLLEQASPQDGQGCPRRLILLLTDGAPAAAQVFRGPILKAHMDRVTKIAGEGMSGKGNFIYVTAFNVIGDNYWAETRKYWEQITCPANADPPCSNDLPRAKRENTANDVAIRMQNIIATHLGYQYQSFSLRAEPVILPVSAYVQSLRLSYYAPDPTAKFTMVDPDGKTVEPDGENVIFDDQDPLVQVLSIKAPKPGNYEITSETGGTVTLLPTYSELTPKIEASPNALQQFTNSEIKLSLLDASGQLVTLAGDPKVLLDLRAEVRLGDQTWRLLPTDGSFPLKVTILPVSSGEAQLEVTPIIRDTQGKNCKLAVETGSGLKVAPVTFQAGQMPEKVCALSRVPVTYPLTLINADTQAPAVISVPVAWEVSSTSVSGHPVEASMDETGDGQYQLSLKTDQAEDIRTSLTASAKVGVQSYRFFTDVLTTTGLLEGASSAYLQLTPKIETSPDPLQQFTNSEIKLSLLDTSGKPVAPADYSKYQLDLQAEVRQGGQTWPLSPSNDGRSFEAKFLPVISEPARMEVTATLRDAQGKEVCELTVEPGGEMSVAPVTFKVGELSGGICTPSQMPLIYPLTLINANTQEPAAISVPIDWEVTSSSLSGLPVDASTKKIGDGQYQLSLRTEQAEDIRTNLTASAKVDGQSYPLDKPYELLTTGLLEDHSLAFELGKPGLVADSLSLFFNRLFRPEIKDYSDHQILIGRRLFGWLGRQDVLVSGRFFNQKTEEAETGIQRFYVQLATEDGGTLLEKANGWIPGDEGFYTLLIPAPRLGAYRVNVIDEDEGKPAACKTLAGLPTLNLLLINDFWEYIFWIVLFLLAFLLLAWLVMMLICRYWNPPWGYLQLVEPGPNGQVVWTGPFVSGDKENARRSCYTWELDPTDFFGIVKIKVRSWNQPRDWVEVKVYRMDDYQVYRGYLGPRCTYICWEDRPWKDTHLEKDFRLTWRKGSPAGK